MYNLNRRKLTKEFSINIDGIEQVEDFKLKIIDSLKQKLSDSNSRLLNKIEINALNFKFMDNEFDFYVIKQDRVSMETIRKFAISIQVEFIEKTENS